MIEIEVKVEGLKEAINSVKALNKHIARGMVILADYTVQKMRDNIKKSVRRHSTGRLANSINRRIGHSGKIFWVGVGEISKLPRYWAVLEFGGYVPLSTVNYGVRGEFEKTGSPLPELAGKGTERWITKKDGKYLLKPKSPIRPLRYIKHTIDWLRAVWNPFWRTYIAQAKIAKFPNVSVTASSFGFPWLEGGNK